MESENQIRFCVSDGNEPAGKMAIRLLETYGSTGLCIGVSEEKGSLAFLKELGVLTSGLLVFNAVLFEDGHLRTPDGAESELLERKWKIPFRWLSLEIPLPDGPGSGKRSLSRIPPYLLTSILFQNGISVFLAAHPGMLKGTGEPSLVAGDFPVPEKVFVHSSGGAAREG